MRLCRSRARPSSSAHQSIAVERVGRRVFWLWSEACTSEKGNLPPPAHELRLNSLFSFHSNGTV
ncbi:hypothetical protein AGR8A_Lc10139 [Agrobacterium fabrum str. J-07]|nr:hypothetical protein AGR8A_Lc10139 [Agrobacterium fabrum str. J-07]